MRLTKEDRAVKERGIIFSAPMVNAILSGSKTVTRRLIKHDGPVASGLNWNSWWSEKLQAQTNDAGFTKLHSPYQSGDRLYVRETWADTNGENGPMISYRAGGDRFLVEDSYPVDYSLYPGCQFSMWCGDLRRGEPGHAWRSPIHMPKWAARIWLEVVSVRPERLTEITEEDAKAEGILLSERCDRCGRSDWPEYHGDYRLGFRCLWQSLHGPDSWEKSIWVWRIEFLRFSE